MFLVWGLSVAREVSVSIANNEQIFKDRGGGDVTRHNDHAKADDVFPPFVFLFVAYENVQRLKSAMQSGSIPTIAIDAPPAVFEAMSKNDRWVEDDEAWRAIAQGFPTGYSGYSNQVRETVLRKKEDGVQFVLLFSVKEERMALLNF